MMLRAVEIVPPGDSTPLAPGLAALAEEMPGLPIRTAPAADPHDPGALTPGRRARRATAGFVTIDPGQWNRPSFNPVALDDLIAAVAAAGPFALRIGAPHTEAQRDSSSGPELIATAGEILTRYQRYVATRNVHASTPLFDAILDRHGALHDTSKPLVAADLDHARDTWRWVLRLQPEASLAVQIAALFHDIERLESEADARVEQHAPDYVEYKLRHAARGAELTREALREVGAGPALVDEVVALVAEHERPGASRERQVLNEADALSFFSLNACGFMDYYGRAHTEKKIAYTLARLGPAARGRLRRIRHRADVRELLTRQAPGLLNGDASEPRRSG